MLSKDNIVYILLAILLTIVCFTSAGLSLCCDVLKRVNNRILSVVCSVFFCRMCLSWTRRASVSDQKSMRMISLLHIHLFHSPHPSHTHTFISATERFSFIASTQWKLWTLFLAREHSVITFFVALLSELLPGHSFPSDFLCFCVSFTKAASSLALCGLKYVKK